MTSLAVDWRRVGSTRRRQLSQHAGQRPPPIGQVSAGRVVGAFLLGGFVVMTAVAAVLGAAQRRIATDEAIRDARSLTRVEATDVVGPFLIDAALQEGPAQAELDRVVRTHVLGSHVVRVKVWDETGKVVYSDDGSLIGAKFGLPDEELRALKTGRSSAEVSHLSAAENRDERRFGKLLQVYQGVRTREGTKLLFETYQPYSVITDSSRRMWLSSLPVLLGGVLLLYLVQAPLAYRMARRLRRSQDEREALLLGTLAASDQERARIAADLHDGVVQGLAGASYSLLAAADRARENDPAAAATMLETAAGLRRWVRELRSLVVTITPPALHAQGLAASLGDLGASLEGRGIAVTVAVSGCEDLEDATESLVYRAAQEAVRNIVRHAHATEVAISVARDQRGQIVLRVRDNGRGIISDAAGSLRRGSVGLQLLGQLATSQGGVLAVDSREGHGTTLSLELPMAVRSGDPTTGSSRVAARAADSRQAVTGSPS